MFDEANSLWRQYEERAHTSFKELGSSYRARNGRHPPPGFDIWYKFARDREVYIIDDFDQIQDDLRPFWGVSPRVLRSRLQELNTGPKYRDGLAILSIRNGSIPKVNYAPGVVAYNWRLRDLTSLVSGFCEYLPDMDIVLNTHDQPRVVVPWTDMEEMLALEQASRKLPSQPIAKWTIMSESDIDSDTSVVTNDVSWSNEPGLKHFAPQACSPDSRAVSDVSEAAYKDPRSGLIINSTLATDLCSIGPGIWDKHGLLFNSLTLRTNEVLLPIFSESKTSINRDLVYPAWLHWNTPTNFAYDPSTDYPWPNKHNTMLWRGTNSGGRYDEHDPLNMHRSRLVLATNNDSLLEERNIIVAKRHASKNRVTIEPFSTSNFYHDNTDVAFNGFASCGDHCELLSAVMPPKENLDFKRQFEYK